jgi:hypothetical protein
MFDYQGKHIRNAQRVTPSYAMQKREKAHNTTQMILGNGAQTLTEAVRKYNPLS